MKQPESNRLIPREEWPKFLDSFNRQHDGWLVTVEVFGPVVPLQTKTRESLFEAVMLEPDESKADQILILVRGVAGRELAHTVKAPISLLFHEKDEGAPQGLDINSEDGETTVLRFSCVARPEMLDAVVSEAPILPELIPAEA
jgi:hypothetical protein